MNIKSKIHINTSVFLILSAIRTQTESNTNYFQGHCFFSDFTTSEMLGMQAKY